MNRHEITSLLRALDQAYDAPSWHGTNLRGSLRRVAAAEAAFRPGAKRHNVWELALHCAYWKYAVRRRLLGEKRGSFPLAGSNFFRRPAGTANEADWKRDVALLDETHRRLREAVAALPAARLGEITRGAKVANRDVVLGIAAHDLYHAGQIQLLKRLARARS
ncbi:MAG TPA: DinB family protein [Thermoanaerobaculia bacterium]|jgi:uncharacterized damage-inducible protein DinB